jgi:hypothetical protein
VRPPRGCTPVVYMYMLGLHLESFPRGGGAKTSKYENKGGKSIFLCVSTRSLGGSGACSPRKLLYFSGTNLTLFLKYLYMHMYVALLSRHFECS